MPRRFTRLLAISLLAWGWAGAWTSPVSAEERLLGRLIGRNRGTLTYAPQAEQPQMTITPVKRKGPSVWSRMGSGTQRFFGNAWDTMTFQKKKGTPTPTSGQTTSSSWSRSGDKKKSSAKKQGSWLGNLFQPKQDDRPVTVNDWMRGERPGY